MRMIARIAAVAAATAAALEPWAAPAAETAAPPKAPFQVGPFKAGFAERDITPDLGMEMPGGYGKIFHRKLHDPCKVRAAVFDDGKMRAALVGVDALMVPRRLVEESRKEIAARSGIEPRAILIGASHSHSSGPTGMVQPGEFDGAPDLVRRLAYELSSCADAAYLERVRKALVEAVLDADSRRADARCGAGVGIEDKVAFNRRFRMKNGFSWTHPGKGNPDIVEPAGPIDPQVGVIGAWSPDGKLLGCVVNYACHATTSPDGISANWIFYMESVIRGALGADAVVVFLQGDAGDVTQVDNRSAFVERPGEDSARFVGGRIGAAAVKVLIGMPRGALAPIDARSTSLRIPRRLPDPARVERCAALASKNPAEADHTEWTFAKEIVLLDWMAKKEPAAEVEIQAVQVGPVAVLSNPGETFCRFGLDLKAASPFPMTFPVELANGCAGYIPTEDALGPGGGGYETRLTSYSNLVPEAGRLMSEAALGLARQMRPGEAPSLPPAPPFKGGAWSYGNVPPEMK
jgi:neutral ceramidase